jgi:hypothetical protein
MKVNLNTELNLILIIIFSLSLSGCFGDYNPPVALGTHLKLMNMGQYIVELNLTDNNEYYIGDVITDNGSVRTGPPDRFTDSSYIKYSSDIIDKKDGEMKLSLNITHYDAITTSDDNLLEHGLSKWPWDGSNPYQTRYMGNYRWIIIKGSEDNEIDAACWIDDNTMFSLRMFDINESDSLAILGSVTFSYRWQN